MGTKAIIREDFVSADELKDQHFVCPGCKSTTVIVRGYSQFPRTEFWENGVNTESKIDQTQHIFEIESIECLACQTNFVVKPAQVLQLEQNNEELRQIVWDVTGKDPYGLGKPN